LKSVSSKGGLPEGGLPKGGLPEAILECLQQPLLPNSPLTTGLYFFTA